MIGLANVGPTRDADDDPESVGEVVSIYVLPEVFGGGYGRALMAVTEARYRRDLL